MKRIYAIALAAIFTSLLLLTGCSANSMSGKTAENYSDSAAEMPYGENYGGTSLYEREGSEEKTDSGTPFELADDPNAKIVWTGSVGMETTEWNETMSGLKALFAKYGVQIMSAEEGGGNRYQSGGSVRTTARYATFVLRVPSENFADFMDGFGDVKGSVTGTKKSRADMTKQYNRNALELELLNTEYDDLKKLLSEAKDLNEIMMIRDRMTEVMTEIRSLSESNNKIDYDVQYSKVIYTLQEVLVYSDPSKTESWFVRFGKSFVNGAKAFGEFIGDAVIWLGENLFFLILFAVIFAVLPLIIIRSCIKKARKKREQANETK
ncbi:MAG: DUF4349 domain-containing protein [Lachnospiraceae bacterium]|nr:DUF4349 domain-containing protein [Lachnospiraceae bacterium]